MGIGGKLVGQEKPKKTGLGLVAYCSGFRRKLLQAEMPPRDLFEPTQFLEHCHQLGAGGLQVGLGVMKEEAAKRLKQQVAEKEMFLEAIISVPKNQADVERFQAEMQTAAQAGALAVRTTIIPGRRYEFFDSLEKYREYATRGSQMLELAAPVAEKHKLPLAVENHKDHRAAERVALFEHIDSEFVGACLDTGNSFALLEDPQTTVEALLPWTFTVHLKDQAVQEYADGFLLGDIPLGQGFLDLKKILNTVKRQKPTAKFCLELITRDPLKVPCLTDSYWSTFPDLPAADLSRTLRTVRTHSAAKLQEVSTLTLEQQVALEESNVRASLEYASQQLGI